MCVQMERGQVAPQWAVGLWQTAIFGGIISIDSLPLSVIARRLPAKISPIS
jgi:hypothetical protein